MGGGWQIFTLFGGKYIMLTAMRLKLMKGCITNSSMSRKLKFQKKTDKFKGLFVGEDMVETSIAYNSIQYPEVNKQKISYSTTIESKSTTNLSPHS